MRLDEILEALPEVGLQVWMICDNGKEGWYVVLHGRGSVPKDNDPNTGYGNGETALEAMVAACVACGVDVRDE